MEQIGPRFIDVWYIVSCLLATTCDLSLSISNFSNKGFINAFYVNLFWGIGLM